INRVIRNYRCRAGYQRDLGRDSPVQLDSILEDRGGVVRRRRSLIGSLAILLGTSVPGVAYVPNAHAGQDPALPPALEERQKPAPTGSENAAIAGDVGASTLPPMPPAPRPIPGPASMAFASRPGDDATPKGLPINLATAMKLAGARPLDIAV